MSQRKKSARREAPVGRVAGPAAQPTRRGYSSAYRPTTPSSRRPVTFALIVIGIVIAVGVVFASFGQGAGSTPGQATVQGGGDTRALDAAVGPLLERVRQNPSDQIAIVELGNAYYDASRWSEAIPWYERALQAAPGNTDVRTDLGTAYYYSGNDAKAKEHWFKVLDQDPSKAQAHFNLGIMYSHQNPPDFDAATKEWETVIKLAPNSDQARSAEQNLKNLGKR